MPIRRNRTTCINTQGKTAVVHCGLISITASYNSFRIMNNPFPLKMRLRVPSWASGNVTVLLNGQRAGTGAPGTYVTLARTWSTDDTVTFNIPMGFRMTQYMGFERDPDRERYGLEYGPL